MSSAAWCISYAVFVEVRYCQPCSSQVSYSVSSHGNGVRSGSQPYTPFEDTVDSLLRTTSRMKDRTSQKHAPAIRKPPACHELVTFGRKYWIFKHFPMQHWAAASAYQSHRHADACRGILQRLHRHFQESDVLGSQGPSS